MFKFTEFIRIINSADDPLLVVVAISLGGSNSMLFTIQFICDSNCKYIHVPAIICLISFQIATIQPSNTAPCGTPYFPTNQPSKHFRSICLN